MNKATQKNDENSKKKHKPKNKPLKKPPKPPHQLINLLYKLTTILTLIPKTLELRYADASGIQDTNTELSNTIKIENVNFFTYGDSYLEIDIYEDYFNFGLELTQTKFQWRSNTERHTASKQLNKYVISPVNQTQAGSSPQQELVPGVSSSQMISEFRYRLKHIGGLSWVETNMVPVMYKGKVVSITEITLSRIDYFLGGFKYQRSLITENINCTNKAPQQYVYTQKSMIGQLHDILHSPDQGYYNLCFLMAFSLTKEERNYLNENGGDWMYFQLGKIRGGSDIQTLDSPKVTMLPVPAKLRMRDDEDLKSLKLEAKVLNYYDDLLHDSIFFFIGDRYLFFQDISTVLITYSETIDLSPVFQLTDVSLYNKDLLVVSGMLDVSFKSAQRDWRVYSLVWGLDRSTKLNGTRHILSNLYKCLKKSKNVRIARIDECFLVRIEGKLLDDHRLDGDMSLILDFKSKAKVGGKEVQAVNTYRWDPESRLLEQFSLKKLYRIGEIFLRLKADSMFIDIVGLNVTDPRNSSTTAKGARPQNKTSTVYHQIWASDQSLSSQPRLQNNIEPMLYRFSNSSKLGDELLDYSYLKINNLLLRRGRTSLSAYRFKRPSIRIYPSLVMRTQIEKKIPFLTYDQAISPQKCLGAYVLLLQYNSSISDFAELVNRSEVVCVANNLRIGSTFPHPFTPTNANSADENSDITAYPLGVDISKRPNTYQFGSFFQINQNSDPKDQLNEPMMTHFREERFNISMDISSLTFFSVFVTNTTIGESYVSLVASLFQQNVVLRSTYHSRMPSNAFNQTSLFDFRQIQATFSMGSNKFFFQIEGMNYLMDLGSKTRGLTNWSGANGVCDLFTKMTHFDYREMILCEFEYKFFVKYIDIEDRTETLEVGLSKGLEYLQDVDSSFVALVSSQEFTNRVIAFSKDASSYGDLTRLTYTIMELQFGRKPFLYPLSQGTIRFKNENINQNCQVRNILGIKMVGRQVVVAISEDGFQALILYSINKNSYLVMTRYLPLPQPRSRIQFTAPFKMVILNARQKLNFGESSGGMEYFIAIKVECSILQNKGQQRLTHGPQMLMIDPKAPSFGSMKLVVLQKGYEFVDFGELFYSIEDSNEVHFAVLAKKTIPGGDMANPYEDDDDDEDMSAMFTGGRVVNKTKLTNLTLLLSSRLRASLEFATLTNISEIFNTEFNENRTVEGSGSVRVDSIIKNKIINFNFSFQSQIYSELDQQKINAKSGKLEMVSQVFSEPSPILRSFRIDRWLNPFKPLNNESCATRKVSFNPDEDAEQACTEHNIVKLDLSKNNSYISWESEKRFIRLNPHNYITGNVFNAFGLVDSVFESRLKILIVPNMSEPSLKSIKTCYHPDLTGELEFSIWCRNPDVSSLRRTLYGCSGLTKVNSIYFQDNSKQEIDENSYFSRFFISSPKRLVSYDSNTNFCYEVSAMNYSKRLERSSKVFIDRFMVYLETSPSNKSKTGVQVVFDDMIGNDKQSSFIPQIHTYRSQEFDLKVSLRNTKLRLVKLKSTIANRMDYFLIIYEYSSRNNYYLDALVYRVWVESHSTPQEDPGSSSSGGDKKIPQNQSKTRILNHFEQLENLKKVDFGRLLSTSYGSNNDSQNQTNGGNSKTPTQIIDDPSLWMNYTIKLSSLYFKHQISAEAVKNTLLNPSADRVHLVYLNLHLENNINRLVQIKTASVYKLSHEQIDPDQGFNVVVQELQVQRLDLGIFIGSMATYFENPKLIVPRDSHDANYRSGEGANKYNSSRVGNRDLFFIVSFARSNSFLIRLPWNYYKTDYKYSFGSREPFLINQYDVAPLSNPFVGFSPQEDTPESIFEGPFFFMFKNFYNSSVLVVYQLNFTNFIQIKIGPDLVDSKAKNFTNVFALSGQEHKPFYSLYIPTKLVIKLNQRPKHATVFTFLYGQNSLYEHKIFMGDSRGYIWTRRFSTDVAVLLHSQSVASNNVVVYIQGERSWMINLILNITGTIKSSFKAYMFYMFKIAVAVLISLIGIIALRAFILWEAKKTKMRIFEKKKKKILSKMKNVTRSIKMNPLVLQSRSTPMYEFLPSQRSISPSFGGSEMFHFSGGGYESARSIVVTEHEREELLDDEVDEEYKGLNLDEYSDFEDDDGEHGEMVPRRSVQGLSTEEMKSIQQKRRKTAGILASLGIVSRLAKNDQIRRSVLGQVRNSVSSFGQGGVVEDGEDGQNGDDSAWNKRIAQKR